MSPAGLLLRYGSEGEGSLGRGGVGGEKKTADGENGRQEES